MPHPSLPGFKGPVYARDDVDHSEYDQHRYQYGYSSHSADGTMNPKLILYPTGDDDIIAAINYAQANKVAIAIRTGGHQYSGASSTFGENIQLDVSETYRGVNDLKFNPNDLTVRASISYSLLEFNTWLRQQVHYVPELGQSFGVFVPHGQCEHVHLGGHVQTGGYGQLGRSFGLFGDHVRQFEIITADAKKRIVDRNSDPDLFYAVLGGSPGNFGVITHLTLQVHSDSNHPDSRGLKIGYFYTNETLKKVLDLLVEMSNNEDFPGDYDLCVTVLTASSKLFSIFPNLDTKMRKERPDLYGEDHLPLWSSWPNAIVVYAQWANLQGKKQPYNKEVAQWFDRLKGANHLPPIIHEIDNEEHIPMSKLTYHWIFQDVREYDLPYIKRTYITNSKTLVQDKWSDWVTNQIGQVEGKVFGPLKLSVQIQPFGGKNGKFFLNRDNGTSYSWRDSNIVCVLDCFYDNAPEKAIEWQSQNDQQAGFSNSKFSKTDRRVFWGSYTRPGESPFLTDNWARYYESAEKYQKLTALKVKYDPNDIFTPNPFSLRSNPQKKVSPQKGKKQLSKNYDEIMLAAAKMKKAALKAKL